MGGFLLPLLVLVVTGAFSSPAVANEWEGLWRVVVPEGDPGVSKGHILIRDNDGVLEGDYFDHDWMSRGYRVTEVDESSLVLQTDAGGRRVVLSLKRDGSTATGERELIHVQYRASAGIKARRIASPKTPNPLDFAGLLPDEDPFIDVGRILRETAPLDSFEEFEVFWAEDALPRFYYLLEDVVFDERSVELMPGAVRRIWEKLRCETFRRIGEEVAAGRKKIIDQLKQENPELYYANVFVSMPSLGCFEVSPLQVGGSFLIRIGIDRFVESEPANLVAWLAREQLVVPFYAWFDPWEESGVARLLREGMAVHLAMELGFASAPRECFLTEVDIPQDEDGVDLEPLKREVGSLLTPAGRRNEPSPEAIMFIGVGFAKKLRAIYSIPEILDLTAERLAELLLGYVEG